MPKITVNAEATYDVDAGPGAATDDTQRTVLATDDPAVMHLAAIEAAVEGTVAVSAAGLPLPSGAATAAKQPALGTAGTPSADVISVQGTSGGTALPVSAAALPLPTGAATAAAQATIAGHVDGIETLIGTTNSTLTTIDGRVDGVEALLGTIDADTSALAGAVAGSELQVDVVTLPALPAGTNNIGDVDVLTIPALKHGLGGYTAAIATVLSTEMNSTASGSLSTASAAIDNSTHFDCYAAITLTIATQGSARATGATVTVYRVDAVDGTNYDDVVAGNLPILAVFPLDAATTARQQTRIVRWRSPGLAKVVVLNSTGQAFAASGNLVEIRFFSERAA